ncbi:MAG: hypothetical protein V7767_06730, partial [Leeuwenhoekiella sp.]
GAEIPPKILREVINEGSFCEDEVTLNYYAGILGSSLSEDGKDDRGIFYTNIINSLSSYQLRFHYLVSINFISFHKQLKDLSTEYNIPYHRKLSGIVSRKYIFDKMNFNENEKLLEHCISGLKKEGLYHTSFQDKDSYLKNSKVNDDLETTMLSRLGIQLYLWCSGNKDIEASDILETKSNNPLLFEPYDIKEWFLANL